MLNALSNGWFLEQYNKMVDSDFPITIIPPTEGYYNPPFDRNDRKNVKG